MATNINVNRQPGQSNAETWGQTTSDSTTTERRYADRATDETVLPDNQEIRVPEAAEQLRVEKRDTSLGEVHVRRTVEEEQQTVPVELEREEVHVERRDVPERPLAEGDMGELRAFEEGTIRIPVRGEQAVVTKEAVVTGEVVINKERTTEKQDVTDTVRRQRVHVDENVDKDYDRIRNDFRSHFDARGESDRSWDDAEPNYRQGFYYGRDNRYANSSFDDVESDVRSSMGYGNKDDRWEHLREEVREGFDRARS